ncbi:MAG TPA: HAD family hydrolase [Stellaceae bacterium]|nr:HAD family hydrolase [Stellaceae bacterium]
METTASGFDLVIFDCDGVLVDSEVISASTLAENLTRIGFPVDLDYVNEHYLGRSFGVIDADHRRRTGRPLPKGFADLWYGELFAAFRRELKPIAGVADVLRRLALPKCVASSSARARLMLSLEVSGLAELCGPHVFDASMVSRGKPAPDLFLYCAERMGAAPTRSLVVEDSITGIAAAVAAGMTAWAFVGGAHYGAGRDLDSLRRAGAVRVFAAMTEFGLE